MVFERNVLPNGLRVLTAPMPQAQSVSCFLMLAAGSRYETREQGGIAHFAEHMFFKGTERRPTAKAISTEIDNLGGEFNAFTGKEYTGYYVKAAAEHRDAGSSFRRRSGRNHPTAIGVKTFGLKEVRSAVGKRSGKE